VPGVRLSALCPGEDQRRCGMTWALCDFCLSAQADRQKMGLPVYNVPTCLTCQRLNYGQVKYDSMEAMKRDSAHDYDTSGIDHTDMLKWLATWGDGALNADWKSCLGGFPYRSDARRYERILRAYVRLRRRSPGWRPKQYKTSNHPNIDGDKLRALLDEAKGSARKRRAGRPSKADGRGRVCKSCNRQFRARRSDARYCGPACRQKAQRVRNRHGYERGNPAGNGVSGERCHFAQNGVLGVTRGDRV
jgi:hypothetical protein